MPQASSSVMVLPISQAPAPSSGSRATAVVLLNGASASRSGLPQPLRVPLVA